MMRKLVSSILLLLVSAGAYPLGLGDIELNSGLNQPFDARIELLSPTQSEMDSLAVRLADIEAFNRAGIELTMVLASLRFEIVQNEIGPDYIHITTREAVREPFLNFLLEASWASGRLFREYTVLLDPPLYDPNARQITTSSGSNVARVAESDIATGSSARAAPVAVQRSTPSYNGDEYGPTSANDTLWSISNQVRPDAGVTTQQMMLALLRSNPEAFIGGNINGLRQGTVLRIPDRNEISTTSADAALAEVRSQNSMWAEMRGSFAGSTSQRAVGSTAQPASGSGLAADTGTDSELRLVSPGSSSDGGQNATASSAANGADLAMANEQLEALASENEDLRGRLEETEALITDLRRLIELKDDELASLQQQMAGGEVIDTVDAGMEEMPADEMADGESMPVSEEQTAVVEEPAVAEQEQAPPPPTPVVTTQPEVMASSGGLVDSILTFIFGNIMLVGGAIAALVIAIAGLTFIRKRKEAAITEGDSAVTEFPDFESPVDETDMAVGSDMDISDENVAVDSDEGQALESAVKPAELEAESDTAEEVPAETAAAEDEEPEDDPLAEVNVFLAYEHFDQAEEFVRDAIEKDTNNLDFHSKLLEVFYSSGDKAKYEEEARVLHELVNGEGPHWEMAMIMWQEISPNRALFAEPADGEEDADAGESTGGGIVDLTADDNSGDDDDGLDFDLGMGDTTAEDNSDNDDVLDITSGSDDMLDLTADPSNGEDEDLLDVTAAVGLDSDEKEDSSSDEDDVLDISAAPAGDDGDPLDVTAQSDIDSGEDILDVTAAVGTEGDSGSSREGVSGDSGDNTMDFDIGGLEMDSSADSDSSTADASDEDDANVIDFDTTSSGSGSDDEISLDMDSGDDDGGLDLDFSSGDDSDSQAEDDTSISLEDSGDDDDGGISLDMDTAEGSGDDSEQGISLEDSGDDDDGGISLDMDTAEGSGDDSDQGISLDDSGDDDDGGISLDLDTGEDSGDDTDQGISLDDSGDDDNGGFSLDMDDDGDSDSGLSLDMDSDSSDDAVQEYALDIDMDDDSGEPESSEFDMDSTVEIPKGTNLGLDNEDDDDDDDEDHTVFVPRTSDSSEQSAEDEVATKLDLAKAYVELGDNDSAGSILDEIIAEGNDAQRQQAEELKGQIS